MLTFLNRLISWSFYGLFFLIPLVFTNDTSELFELNKMWLTWALTIIIGGAWIIKMAYVGRLRIQRTPLDIPILLFLISQLLSTVISLDPHTSFWGYYSRFNGGFLSLITYAFLFYAFVSNIEKEQLMGYIYAMLLSGIFVALWGLPSHFGYDPTCLLFRGTFDVSCWTNAFQPKVRIFSTLGQPDWLSAYLGALIPLSFGLSMYFWEKAKKIFAIGALLTTFLFYLDFLYAKSRGGYIGLAVAIVLFGVWFVREKHLKFALSDWKKVVIFPLTIIGFLIITFLVGTSVSQIDHFTLPELLTHFQPTPKSQTISKTQQIPSAPAPISPGEFGGTDSSKIRLYVWSGALDAWIHYPIFGTGVETFAYAYYLFMPPGHNLTSEFDYLYNKAHNEYLNYLATTGIIGLGTYLVMIGLFLFVATKRLLKPYQLSSSDMLLAASFLACYVSILISNFFGFSVVIMNIFLFLFPAFVFIYLKKIDPEKVFAFPAQETNTSSSVFVWIVSGIVILVGGYFLSTLFVFWNADKAYGLGQNYVNVGDYQSAYQPLQQAISLRPTEPVFQDEASLDDAVLAAALVTQDKSNTTTAQQLAQTAIQTSDNLVQNHPNIVTFWKTRVRIFYALAQINPQYLAQALAAIQKASELAPTDAKVTYNLGLLYGQTGNYQQAITTLQQTIALKKDYRDAYYALGLFYHAAGVDKNGKVTNPDLAQKGIDEMHFILEHFNATDAQATDALKAWGAE